MRYWLFQIMHADRRRPEGSRLLQTKPPVWPKMIEMGVAAQHYPVAPHPVYGDRIYMDENRISEAKKNLKALMQLKCHDWVVAAFTELRFAGYGHLTSNFYQGGDGFGLVDRETNLNWDFYERFNCNWTIIPLDKKAVDCRDLALPLSGKKKEKDIWLHRGLCVKEIEKTVFEKLKARLDNSGAKPISSPLDKM